MKNIQSTWKNLFTPVGADVVSVAFWRQRILSYILYSSAVMGLLVLVLNASIYIQEGNWGTVLTFVVAYLLVLVMTFASNLPYAVRGGFIIVVLYGLATLDIYQNGMGSDGLVWLFAAVALASILFGIRTGVSVLALCVVSLVGLGLLIGNGVVQISIEDPEAQLTSISVFTEIAIDFVFLSAILVTAIGLLINGLDIGLKTSQDLTTQLETEQKQLEEAVREMERRTQTVRIASDLARSISGNLDVDSLLKQVVQRLQEDYDLDHVSAYLVDATSGSAILRAATGEIGQTMLETGWRAALDETTPAGIVLQNRTTQIFHTTASEKTWDVHHLLQESESIVALPVQSSTRLWGALVMFASGQTAFEQDDLPIFEGLANSVAITLENAALIVESRRLAESEQVVAAIASQVWTANDVETVLQTSVRELVSLLNASEGTIVLNSEPEIERDTSA